MGTDEIRFLIFRLQKTDFAINVLNIREIIKQIKANEIPNAPWGIQGVFKIREEVLPVVELCEYLGYQGIESKKNDGAIIIVETCGVKYGILVDAVDVIKGVTANAVQDPSDYIKNTEAPIIGTIEIDKRTVQIPDLDKITGELFSTENQGILEQNGAEVKAEETAVGSDNAKDGTPAFNDVLKELPIEDLKKTPELNDDRPFDETSQWDEGSPSFNNMLEDLNGELSGVKPEMDKSKK